MIGADDPHTVTLEELFPQPADRFGRVEQGLGRHGSQAADELGPHDRQLPLEMLAAIGHLVGRWGAVARGTAAEDVADIDVLAAEMAGFDDLVEQLAGPTDKGLAQAIFVGTGGLAKKAEPGVGIADAEDGLRSRGGQLGTKRASGHLGPQNIELLELALACWQDAWIFARTAGSGCIASGWLGEGWFIRGGSGPMVAGSDCVDCTAADISVSGGDRFALFSVLAVFSVFAGFAGTFAEAAGFALRRGRGKLVTPARSRLSKVCAAAWRSRRPDKSFSLAFMESFHFRTPVGWFAAACLRGWPHVDRWLANATGCRLAASDGRKCRGSAQKPPVLSVVSANR